MKISFENYEMRIDRINEFLKKNGIGNIEEAKAICDQAGIDVNTMVKNIQRICFEDAGWAYVTGAAVAIKRGDASPTAIAETLGEGLQSFCLKGSVA